MMKILGSVIVILLFALSAQANTDNKTIHTFNAGETISSSKVNQNFVISSNYVVKSNGEIIGDLLSFDVSDLYIITSKGYIFSLNSRDGEINSAQGVPS